MNGLLLIALLPTSIALLWAVVLTLQAHEQKRYARVSLRGKPTLWYAPPCALVCVPCKGIDLELETNLRAVLSQQYASYRVRFVVESESDPAYEVIEDLMQSSRVPCELIVAGTCVDSGQKVHNLICATSNLPDDVEALVFFDSDAKPAPDAVARLVDRVFRGPLQAATGYRWFVPRRVTLPNLTLASVNASVAGLLNHQGWNLVWGGSWAVTREVFEQTGLAEAWRGTLSDDLVASRVLRRAGVKLAFEPGCMTASPIDVSWSEAASFLRRQFMIGRCYAPYWWWVTLPLMVLQPLVLLGGIILGGYMTWQRLEYWYAPWIASGLLYVLSELRARWRQAAWNPRMKAPAEVLRLTARFDQWAACWSCLFATGVMLTAAFGRSIVWRGVHYYMGPAGRVTLLGRVPTSEQRCTLRERQAQRIQRDDAARCCADKEVNTETLDLADCRRAA